MATAHSTTTDGIEYRDIEGWPGYRVGTDGTVWRLWVNCSAGRKLTDRWRQMKVSVHKNRTPGRAYRFVNLTPPEGGRYKTFRVHRLVLLAFVGPCPEGMESRHLDGDPGNNRLDNLAWGTPEENREDNRRLGRYSGGRRNRMYTHDDKTLSLTEWAKALGVPYSCLYQRVTQLGMTFEEAISLPFVGHAANGGRGKKLRRQPTQ
jgi:hypothetical protein